MKIVEKIKHRRRDVKSEREKERERKPGREREKEGIKNQQTTNNIILTSRAIFRALMASLRGEIQKEPKACFSKEKQHRELFGVRKPQTEQYLKGLNEGS